VFAAEWQFERHSTCFPWRFSLLLGKGTQIKCRWRIKVFYVPVAFRLLLLIFPLPTCVMRKVVQNKGNSSQMLMMSCTCGPKKLEGKWETHERNSRLFHGFPKSAKLWWQYILIAISLFGVIIPSNFYNQISQGSVPFSIRFVALIKNACSATRFLKGFRLDSLTLRSALGIFQIYLSLAKDSTSS